MIPPSRSKSKYAAMKEIELRKGLSSEISDNAHILKDYMNSLDIRTSNS